MTQLEFFALQIAEWKRSRERRIQIEGYRYYENEQDILERKRKALGDDGKLHEVHNLPNSRLLDNQYALMVDQKKSYSFSKPFSIDGDNEVYNELLNKVFDRRFRRKFFCLGEDALIGGIAWLFPYYDTRGEMQFRRFPAYEILPFWADDEHERLDCAVRLYEVPCWEGTTKKTLEKVEIYKPDGIYRYQLEGSALVPDPDAEAAHSPHFTVTSGKKTTAYNWERIPLIAFRCSRTEQPLLKRVKCLQDALNLMLSDFANIMQENAGGSGILVIKNYDGEKLDGFRHNTMIHRAIKVRSTPQEEGGVEALDIEVNAENYELIISLLKKAIMENARGFDAKDEKMSGAPNQMNILSMYSDISLDADNMEIEFSAALEGLLWWINQWLATTGKGQFDAADVEFTFNRDMLMNESQVITDIRNSEGILSKRSMLNAHPWVKDVDEEMKRLEEDEQQAMELYSQPDLQHGEDDLHAKP